jgi:hypothetical protein
MKSRTNGNVIVCTWNDDKLDGEATLQVPGKESKMVVFSKGKPVSFAPNPSSILPAKPIAA